MYELFNWLDKHINEISDSDLYKKNFSDRIIDNIEEDFFLENLDKGIDVIFTNEMIVSSIHLYSDNFMGSKSFKGDLPFNLEFYKTKKEVNKMLGEPMVSGGGYDDSIFGYVDLWDKYYYDFYSLHVKYAREGERILLITLGTLRFEETIVAE